MSMFQRRSEEKREDDVSELRQMKVTFEEVGIIPEKKEFIGNHMCERTAHLMEQMSCMPRGKKVKVHMPHVEDKKLQEKMVQRCISSFDTAKKKLAPYKVYEKSMRGTGFFIERIK